MGVMNQPTKDIQLRLGLRKGRREPREAGPQPTETQTAQRLAGHCGGSPTVTGLAVEVDNPTAHKALSINVHGTFTGNGPNLGAPECRPTGDRVRWGVWTQPPCLAGNGGTLGARQLPVNLKTMAHDSIYRKFRKHEAGYRTEHIGAAWTEVEAGTARRTLEVRCGVGDVRGACTGHTRLCTYARPVPARRKVRAANPSRSSWGPPRGLPMASLPSSPAPKTGLSGEGLPARTWHLGVSSAHPTLHSCHR